MSEFDLCVVMTAVCGLAFFLGVQSGRAAVWRELKLLTTPTPAVDPTTTPNGNWISHGENRRPPETQDARITGRPSKVIGRKRFRPQREEE